MEDVDKLVTTIRSLHTNRKRTIVAIDGRCGSGKTTLAAELSDIFDCTVFHMDDFFPRKEQRTPERLSKPGEFVDHERFLEEILLPAIKEETVYLRRFSHRTFEPEAPVPVEIRPLVIVEGSYSCHPKLRNHYDLKVFATTDPETQMKRIRRRNPDKVAMFTEKWIPL